MIDGERPPEALGRYTGFLLNWVGARSREAFAAALDKVGLRLQQFAVMNMIAAEPGQTQQGLVASTRVDASTMVQTLDALEAAGLAERRPHPTDRRKRALYLTPAGEKLLTKARKLAGKMGDEVFSALDAGERAQLNALLRKAAGLEKLD
jgi:DNA-binding MarR family transcriptional regulator